MSRGSGATFFDLPAFAVEKGPQNQVPLHLKKVPSATVSPPPRALPCPRLKLWQTLLWCSGMDSFVCFNKPWVRRRRTAGIAAGHALKRPRHATPNNSDNNNNSNSDTDDGPSHASSKGSLESPPYIPSPRPPQPPPPHELFLPWLPDRFYVNAIAAESDPIEKESKRAEEDEKLDEGSTGERSMAARCCRVKVGAMEGEAGDVGAMGRNGRVEGGDEGKDKGGGRWQQQRQRQCEVRRTFSLAKLVEVVSGGGGGGEDWPGIKAAVFGTFSMDMRY